MNPDTPLYIFDLDGTLALIEHRRHFVEGDKKDWPAFFAACVNDAPNQPVIEVLRALVAQGNEVRIWSGRSDEVRQQTEDWIDRNVCCPLPVTMRKAGDHQPDEKLKADWLAELPGPDRLRLVAIFDDRDRVVAMWRSKGVTCLQVAPGNF